MNIDHLREFVYLAEALSYKDTATHFYISQSVLSKHIASLEEDLGEKLLDRDRRHVELTEVGRAFHDDCLVILNDYDYALSRVAALSKAGRRIVRCGYLRGAASPFLGRFVQHLEASGAPVELRLTCMEYGELLRALNLHRIDVAFSMDLMEPNPGEFECSEIYRDRFYVVVNRTNPLAQHASGIRAEDLAGQRVLLPRPSSYPGLAEFIRRTLPAGSGISGSEYYDDIDTLFMRVEEGGLLGFSSGHNFPRYGSSIAFIPLVDRDTGYSICAWWPKERLDPVVLEAVSSGVGYCRGLLAAWDGMKHPSE